jgi:hypothetical protein
MKRVALMVGLVGLGVALIHVTLAAMFALVSGGGGPGGGGGGVEAEAEAFPQAPWRAPAEPEPRPGGLKFGPTLDMGPRYNLSKGRFEIGPSMKFHWHYDF